MSAKSVAYGLAGGFGLGVVYALVVSAVMLWMLVYTALSIAVFPPFALALPMLAPLMVFAAPASAGMAAAAAVRATAELLAVFEAGL